MLSSGRSDEAPWFAFHFVVSIKERKGKKNKTRKKIVLSHQVCGSFFIPINERKNKEKYFVYSQNKLLTVIEEVF